MLNSKERAYLRGMASTADTLFPIGKDGVTENLVAQVDDALRARVIALPSYGDGKEESSALAARLFGDLYRLSRDLPTAYGGQFRIGYNQFTEVIFWGKTLRALPNGRRLGDYICQGLTPSRLQRPHTAIDLLDSLRGMDLTLCGGNASMTLTLPAGGMDSDRLVAFLRMAARCGTQAIQPNCIDRETLLAAQRDPDSYRHIIVRVCGFSAPFVLLSKEYQTEILERMYTETV